MRGCGRGLDGTTVREAPEACRQPYFFPAGPCALSGMFWPPGQSRSLGTLGQILPDTQEARGRGGVGGCSRNRDPCPPVLVRSPLSWLERGVAERGASYRAPPPQCRVWGPLGTETAFLADPDGLPVGPWLLCSTLLTSPAPPSPSCLRLTRGSSLQPCRYPQSLGGQG